MQGLAIFTHALRMVFGNFGAALRIGGVALAVLVALNLSLAALPRPGAMSAPVLGLTLLRIVVGLWVAVAWHRYILLEERPGALLPAWNGTAIWDYLKAGFVLGLILLVVLLPVAAVAGMLMVPMAGAVATSAPPRLLMALLGFLVTFLPAIYIFYRLSPVLPGAAIGRKLTLREAWFQTGTSGWAFVTLTLASVIAGWLLEAPVPALAGFSLILTILWSAVTQWLVFLVGASIMTTIYGHYIEKRDLNA